MEKRCSRCLITKPILDFHKNKNTKDKHHYICKLCNNKQSSVWTKNNYQKVIDNKNKRRKDPRYSMYEAAKTRAVKNKIPFNITIEDIFVPEFCPALKIKLIKSNKRFSDSSPSLDKINPKLGYVKNNIQVISLKANTMKNNATHEELTNFAKWILKHE